MLLPKNAANRKLTARSGNY